MKELVETDWEVGKPPASVEVDVFIGESVRRGYSDGSQFVFVDCDHPAQNMIADLEKVSHWRIRDSVKVIHCPSYAAQCHGSQGFAGLSSLWESLAGSSLGSIYS